jgi:hypothetical protein
MKLLLVSIPLEFPLANYCIAAQLACTPETQDIEISLLNLNARRLQEYYAKSTEIWRYLAHVQQFKPDVIAFSVYLWSNIATHTNSSPSPPKYFPGRSLSSGGLSLQRQNPPERSS